MYLEPPSDIIEERNKETLYIYGKKGLSIVEIENEEKDIWRLLLESKRFKEAFSICKKYNSPHTSYVI